MYFRYLLLALILLTLATAVACGPAPTPAPKAAPSPARAVAPTAVPPTAAAISAAPTAVALVPGLSIPVSVTDAQRKIIKNAQLRLTVESTDSALDRLTGIAADMGGYIISTRTFFEAGLKAATITFAVPVDRFEDTLRRVRAVALKVEHEEASGQDVTDQYVDLESQLRNLEATAGRIRDFLNKAQTVEEALKVNQQLSAMEKDIETVKGKMNYLQGRSAFSTITVDIREPSPTPTPTPTRTPTLTPTPVGWHPDETLKGAVSAQTTLLKALVDMGIWMIVVLLPYLIVFGGFAWLVVRVRREVRKRPSGAPGPPPETAGAPGPSPETAAAPGPPSEKRVRRRASKRQSSAPGPPPEKSDSP